MTNLAKILTENVSGGTFISLDTRTSLELKKKVDGETNPHYGRIVKVQKAINAMVFQNKKTNAYENMQNKALDKAGLPADFKVSPRVWGSRVKDTPFVVHNGQYYVEVIVQHAGVTEYLFNGKPIALEDIKGLKAADNKVSSPIKEPVLRVYKVSSIDGILVAKRYYANLYMDISELPKDVLVNFEAKLA